MSYIKLHTELLDSEIFASEKGLKIWIWLLLRANYKKRFIPIIVGAGQSIITLERGQLIYGRIKAEDQIGIDGSTIYKWLKKMESLEMILINSNHHYTIITICKYDEYNHQYESEVNATSHTNQTPSNSQVITKETPSNTPHDIYNPIRIINNDYDIEKLPSETSPQHEVKKRIKKEFKKPELKEVIDYFCSNGYTRESAIRAFNYYDTANWNDSQGRPVRNWKQKMIAVWFKPENKQEQNKDKILASPIRNTNIDAPKYLDQYGKK